MKRLVLFADRSGGWGTGANCIYDSINAILSLPGWDVTYKNPRSSVYPGETRKWYADAVVIHWTVRLNAREEPFLRDIYDWVLGAQCPRILYAQDEYFEDSPGLSRIKSIGPDYVFSLLPVESVEEKYAPAKIMTTLAGYVPERMLGEKLPLEDRDPIIFNRVRKVEFLGERGMEKTRICEAFENGILGLLPDISQDENDRLYGMAWDNRLASVRFLLLAESAGQWEGGEFGIISPRAFEAAASKTCMVGFRDWYSGVLVADRHYIALDKNLSNYDDVCRRMLDLECCQKIVDRTYREIAENPKYQYSQMQRDLLETINK